MQAVVLSFDRLPLRLWGCYGQTDAQTPHTDRLAAQAVVFDQHFAEDLSANATRHAWWSGRHEFPPSRSDVSCGSPLLPTLAANGIAVRLLTTSDPQPLVPLPSHSIEIFDPGTVSADLALIEHGCERLADMPTPRMLWLKCRGLPDPVELDRWQNWIHTDDARQLFDRHLQAESAEDAVQQWSAEDWAVWRRLCAGEARRIDAALGRFFEQLESSGRTLLIWTAGQGGRLGERAGDLAEWAMLAEEIAHVPLVIRDTGHVLPRRSATLTQSVDLPATLRDWFGVTSDSMEARSLLPILSGQPIAERSRLCWGTGDGSFAVRTGDYCLISHSGPDDRHEHLFVKPDDRWDIHDVAAQEPETVAHLSGWGRAFLEL